MLKLILVRHGTTLANESGQYIGRSESPLSPKGQHSRGVCSSRRIE